MASSTLLSFPFLTFFSTSSCSQSSIPLSKEYDQDGSISSSSSIPETISRCCWWWCFSCYYSCRCCFSGCCSCCFSDCCICYFTGCCCCCFSGCLTSCFCFTDCWCFSTCCFSSYCFSSCCCLQFLRCPCPCCCRFCSCCGTSCWGIGLTAFCPFLTTSFQSLWPSGALTSSSTAFVVPVVVERGCRAVFLSRHVLVRCPAVPQGQQWGRPSSTTT